MSSRIKPPTMLDQQIRHRGDPLGELLGLVLCDELDVGYQEGLVQEQRIAAHPPVALVRGS